MTILWRRATLPLLLVGIGLGPSSAEVAAQAGEGRFSRGVAHRALTVEDAIRMVRIEDRYGTDDRFAVFSPDGSKLATVVWRGDLERDVNLYSLLVFDVQEALANPRTTPDPVLSIPFHGDTANQLARPVEQLAFLDDNRTVTFLGTLDGEPRQVWAVDSETGDVRALTWHPTAVMAYAVAGDGRVRLYAASTPDDADSARLNRLRKDGFSPYDPELFGDEFPLSGAVPVISRMSARETASYFSPGEASDAPHAITDAGQLREQLPLETVLHGLWAPDGASVMVRAAPADWRELEAGSREGMPVPIPEGWSAVRWDEATGLILLRGDSLAAMQKDNGSWGPSRLIGVISGLNRRRPVVTNGRIAVGVIDSLTVPPELAALDLATGEITVLTDLNPELRDRAYGEIEQLRFSTSVDSVATGWVIKPVGFDSGRRYPLVVLHANERERPEDQSYLIDGRHNLSGHAAQPLAAHGFMVLFIGESQYNRTRTPTARTRPRRLPSEIEAVRENVAEAIRALARKGYVDTLRVGVSGWSRSAWYTDQLLIHSPFPFAAATQIDGGTRQYGARLRPYTDEELRRIDTPLLLQHHGLLQLVYAAGMADRLRAMGKPIDVLYFPTAPHSTKQPRHRWRSLTMHVDWWRFWLQGYEDPDPTKAAQYRRWRSFGAW
jgi:dipeptidyl aminopeptidase/acylaminoacyl peptidase